MSGHIRTIKQVQVEDVQKRRIPSKHYVYVIKVTWSDGSRHIVYRRYSRFFDFQLSLLEKFPIEGGAVDPQKRIIPFLPGKIIFGRSHIREVALKRLGQIDDYCSGLIKLPPHISGDEEVLDFFDLEPDDLTPPEQKQKQKTAETISGPTLAEQYIAISDYKKADKWDLNLKAGMILEVVEKSDSGWWFVNIDDKQGWVPSSYLERKDGLKENTAIRTNLGEDERYISTENYTPNNSDEVALEKGTIVEVLEKNLDGWWFVRSNNEEGIVPSTYLMKTEKAHIERVARASGVQIVGSMSDVSDLLKDAPNSESVHSNRTNVQHILKKQRSLERGGSLRPPPRLNSVKKASKEEMKSLKKTEDHYVTVSEFVDTVGDGITFGRGEIVEVIEKSDSGWWFVKINGQEGWAPATYIEKTHMVDIEEEDNVYQDIEDVDNNKHISDSDSDSDDDNIYEIPEPVDEDKKSTLQNESGPAVPMRIKPSDLSSAKQLKGVSDKEAMKRPNSRPPPPPLGLKQVNIDKDDDFTSRKSSNSSSSSAPPVPPPKKKDKPASGANVESSGIHNLQDALKAKLSSDRPPQPPPKTQKSSAIGGKIHDKIGISNQKKPPIVEAKSKFSKNVEIKKENNSTNNSEGPKKYSYTDVLPKNQRESSSSQESIVDVLKSKFANRQDAFDAEHRGSNNSSPFTSPKSDTSVKSFVLPPKKIQKPETPPKKESPFSTKQLKHVYNKDVANQKDNGKDGNDADNKSMNEIKARFEKQRPDLSKKPVLQSKPATNVKPSFNKNRQSENSEPTVDNKLSGKANALKAMFENSKTDAGVIKQKVAKTSSGGSSNSSKTSGIAAMLNSKFESDKAVLKQPQFSKPDTSSKPPLLPTKPNTDSSKTASVVPHALLKPKNSIPPPLPSKSYNKKPAGIEKQNISPAKVDKNHNEMENKEKENVSGISKVLANKMQTNISSNKSAGPAPPAKDYEMISSYRTPCYRTVTDFVAESDGEVGFTTGEIIDVLQETGDWWFIRVNGKEGWAPATYIEQFEVETCDEVFHKQYRAVVNFATESEGEVGLSIGDVLDLIEESDSGWWFVKKDSVEGWTPSSYLEPV